MDFTEIDNITTQYFYVMKNKPVDVSRMPLAL
jgi:hypothetical protein